VSAGKVPIEAPGSVVFKDLAYLGISKHGARFAPASPLGQGAPLHGPLKAAARAVAELSPDGPYGGVKKVTRADVFAAQKK